MSKALYQKIIFELLRQKGLAAEQIAQIKRKIAGEKKMPSPNNVELLETYRQMLMHKKIRRSKLLEKLLRKREIRTLSGVAVITVLTKPYPCPGACLYCPAPTGMPKSYLSNEPAAMRAVLCKFDPYKQVAARLESLYKTGHPTDKIELIILGGTWSVYPKKYQEWFIKRCFEAANSVILRTPILSGDEGSHCQWQHKIKNLLLIQKQNEHAKHRIIGLTIETRPDYVNEKEIKWLRELGCTRVELGVQHLDDAILKLNRRGHTIADTIRATRLLKDAGFKVCYHMMPNLPGATPQKDIQMFQKLFTNPDFQPDMLKIYPCVVLKSSPLYRWWKQKKYKPYSDKILLETLVKIKTLIPLYVRLIRLIRDIPGPSIEAGNKMTNLREIVQKEMQQRGLFCQCIRCREAGHQGKIKNPTLRVVTRRVKKLKLFATKYPASNGMEYFLSYESADRKILYAFLRMRIPGNLKGSLPELKDAILIRELHTYGHLVPLSHSQNTYPRNPLLIQHKGLGKKLMTRTETIVKKLGVKKIAVIAGIGVREYYRQLSYRQQGTYMVKYL